MPKKDHAHVYNMEMFGIQVCEHCGRDAVVCPTCKLCTLCVLDKRAVETIYDPQGRV